MFIPTVDIRIVLIVLVSCAVFIPIGYFLCFFITTKKRRIQERESRRAIDEAHAQADRIKKTNSSSEKESSKEKPKRQDMSSGSLRGD